MSETVQNDDQVTNPFPKRRGILLINRRFQITFLVLLTLGALGILGISFGAKYYFVNQMVTLGKEVPLPPDHVYFQFIHQQQVALNAILLLTALVTLGFIFTYGLLFSNWIAGPIYRVCKELNSAKTWKDLDEINLRKKDYFQELADAINSLNSRSK